MTLGHLRGIKAPPVLEQVTVRTVVTAVWGLKTREATFFAARFLMEPVAVRIEFIFGKFFVISKVKVSLPGLVARQLKFSTLPGFGFDAEAFDIGSIRLMV